MGYWFCRANLGKRWSWWVQICKLRTTGIFHVLFDDFIKGTFRDNFKPIIMGLNYLSLDKTTRQLMKDEFDYDLAANSCFLSRRFNQFGNTYYVEAISHHILEGNDDTLAEDLKSKDCFKTHEERNTVNGTSIAKIPINASQLFSEGEFNRFYIRALCLRALEEAKNIEVYRARASTNPRPESELLIGQRFDPRILLNDLRDNKGIDTSLGLPNGPNSGLSLKLV